MKRLLVAPASALCLLMLGAASPPPGFTVHVRDFRYAPTPLRVRVGDRVTFANDDDEAHTVTASDKSFDSAGLDSNETWTHVFLEAGTYNYFCQLHPYMKGTIVVSDAAGPAR